MIEAAKILFKYRSYIPIPFILVMFFYENANIWSIIAGLIIAVTGEFIRLWGVSWAGSETRTTGEAGATYLVISGPFGYVRNPLYIGNILIYTGIGIISFALFPYLQLFALLFFSLQYYAIVRMEEESLIKIYTQQYENYKKNVSRFIPRLKPYKTVGIPQPVFSVKAGLRSEKRTFQAFAIVLVTLIVKWAIRTRMDSIF